jgi:hypothetical protein
MKKILLTLLLLGGAAWAGQKYTSNYLTLDRTQRYARGPLGGVRNNDHPLESIGCYVGTLSAFPSDSIAAWCYAKDATNYGVLCSTSNSSLIQAARSINGDSFLEFSWDTSGHCNWIWVENLSDYEPKVR